MTTSDLTREKMKQVAIDAMEKLGIYKPYIDGFEKEDKVCFFEGYGGFWLYQKPEIEAKMKQLEAKFGFLIFAVTHELTSFGEIWDFLYVSQYPEEWNNILCKGAKPDTNYIYAYCWNKSDEMCTDIGEIGIKSFGGGIRRIW